VALATVQAERDAVMALWVAVFGPRGSRADAPARAGCAGAPGLIRPFCCLVSVDSTT
jgi:hypothetical protein